MALARMKKILVINNHDSFTYNLVDLIRITLSLFNHFFFFLAIEVFGYITDVPKL